MISIISDISQNVAFFKASNATTKKDYDQVVKPFIDELVIKTDSQNFLIYFDEDTENLTSEIWLSDALVDLKHIGKWNRTAIITDSKSIIHSTYIFSKVMPGEFKGFSKEAYEEAIRWISSSN